jgi:predicted ATP-grasp superfamily ATP-dependent carboligase
MTLLYALIALGLLALIFGLILGFAKQNGIQGIGMYGELNDPQIPQYRAAISIIKTLEKLTYRKLGDISSLELMAQETEKSFEN